MNKRKLTLYWGLLKDAFNGFMDDRALKLSASLSYYTIFSLSPMLIVIISISSLFYGREAIEGEISEQIQDLVGTQAAAQIEELLRNAQLSQQSGLAAVIGIGTLVIGATGIFAEIQDSINSIWGVKPKPKQGWLKYIVNRLLSFSMIVSIGFLLLVSLVINAAIDLFSRELEEWLDSVTIYVFYVVNLALVASVITVLFALIYRVLPDGRLRWKDAFVGAAFTALLFMIGKFVIGAYLSQPSVSSTYGAAGSVIILLLWVYYSAAILFFGAEFTKAYANKLGKGITPKDHAVLVQSREIVQQPEEKMPDLSKMKKPYIP
jgi:membrane protein